MAEALLPEACRTVWVRLGQAAYLGPSLRLAPHSGSVECVVVGVDAPFTLLVGDTERHLRTAVVPARTRHQVSAAEVAREVHLSTSRFLHLFSAHAGTSFRRYRLWTRMTRVAAAISAGQDLTRASADAGFASPAHFSDTFRGMFGLSATTLLAAGTRVVVG